ncbi:uncharacterized protein LOC130591356 [Beta vulgaris subsp. vulgaris]|uniref:uncharacterized protein LOC130591356 n=1 Tax=Beta vulgaris subsp. vulgaris TaxID=3555 RepID=UPI002546E510|nr:uncharacterized protein LOC130591356 [Beta vulgaris subsp. vulgaris]
MILKGVKRETLYVLQGSTLSESGVATLVVCDSVEKQVEHRGTLGWSGGSRQGEICQHSQSESEIPCSSSSKLGQSNLTPGQHEIFGDSPQRDGCEDMGGFALYVGEVNSQFIHCLVKPRNGVEFGCTFVYGFNEVSSRMELWDGLRAIYSSADRPWVLLGDFNALSNTEDRVGSMVRENEIRPMLECLTYCQLLDVKATGRHFTWNNKQEGHMRVLSRIDRVLASQEWIDEFQQAEVTFLPEGDYDHTPMVLKVYPEMQCKKPFRFMNMWCNHKATSEIVRQIWQQSIRGCAMYRVMQRLSRVKLDLKKMNKEGFGDVEANLINARQQLFKVQEELHLNVNDSRMATREKLAQEELHRAKSNHQSYLRQKSKITWLSKGMRILGFFTGSEDQASTIIKCTPFKGCVGIGSNHEQVEKAFLEYYKDLFSCKEQKQKVFPMLMNKGKLLNEQHYQIINAAITREDVKRVMYSIPDEKSPGAMASTASSSNIAGRL